MFSDGTATQPVPIPRLCPAKIHLPWFASPVLSKRLAKTLYVPEAGAPGCSRTTSPTERCARPAKSIVGASPSALVKLSEPVNVGLRAGRAPTVPSPRVVHAPAANDRERICSWGPFVSCWRNLPGNRRLASSQRPPNYIGVGGAVAVDADGFAYAGGKVIVDLSSGGERLKGGGPRRRADRQRAGAR